MSDRDGATAHVEKLIDSVAELVTSEQLEMVRSHILQDPVVTMTVPRPVASKLVLRVSEELILVSVDESQAIEFGWADASEIQTLTALVQSFCRGGFDVQVGSKDHDYYRLRGTGFALTIAHDMFSRLRSGRLVWHTIEQTSTNSRE